MIPLPSFEAHQWALGVLAAGLIGVSKTGIPGAGVLVVPLMALVFNDRSAVGATLLLLIAADVFAVAWYRRYADWGTLRALAPWVVAGIIFGAFSLLVLGEDAQGRDLVNRLIGAIVLGLIGVYLVQTRLSARARSAGVLDRAIAGGMAGFATAVSNAAGPILVVYLNGLKLSKLAFIGTTAFFFFTFNLIKVPLYIVLTAIAPERPIFTAEGLVFDVFMLPAIWAGVWAGRWVLPRLSQQTFNRATLALAALAAVQLLIG